MNRALMPDGSLPSRLHRAGAIEGFGQNGRVVRYVFSTPAVGRDMHTVASDAWQLANFLRNPVFLWAHDDTLPPIGRVVELGDVAGVLKGTVEYADRDLNPFADTIYRLVQGGYISAVSTSWQPLEWSFARDKNRPGGVDFSKVDLLEVSQVPIPALPAALAEARSRGIDTGPIYDWAERVLDKGGMILVPRNELEDLRRAAKMPPAALQRRLDMAEWKVGPARNLPIEDSDDWDGAAAAASIFEWAGGDDFDATKARKGFLVYDADAPEKRGSYKLPIARVVDGELKVPTGAIRAATSRLSQADVPEEVKTRAQAMLDHYKEKAGIGDEGESKRSLRGRQARALKRAPIVPNFRRGLCEVASLAWMLDGLGYAHSCAEWEKDLEGDDSEVPAMLGEALKVLGEALLAMTAEEVAELLSAHLDEDDQVPDVEARDLPESERAFIGAGRTPQARAWRRGIALARAGRTLSASNEKKLEAAQGHHERAMKHHRAVGEHHEAVGAYMETLRGVEEKTSSAHDKLGEALTAARDNPDEALEHVKRALGHHRALADHLETMGETHRDMADRNEDLGDSHRALGRSVKAAQRCVRSVVDGAAPEDDEDSAGEGGKGGNSADDADEEKQRRQRRLKAIQLRGGST